MTGFVRLQVDVNSRWSHRVSGSVSVVVYCRCETVQMHADAVSSIYSVSGARIGLHCVCVYCAASNDVLFLPTL